MLFEAQLQDVESEIEKLSVGSETLEDYLEQLARVLGHPGEFIRLESRSVKVTRMGFKTHGDEAGDEISYSVFRPGDAEFVVTPVRFARDDLLPEKSLSDARVL